MIFFVASSKPFTLGFYTATAALTTAATTVENGFHMDYTQVGHCIREINKFNIYHFSFLAKSEIRVKLDKINTLWRNIKDILFFIK